MKIRLISKKSTQLQENALKVYNTLEKLHQKAGNNGCISGTKAKLETGEENYCWHGNQTRCTVSLSGGHSPISTFGKW